jgi:hypothetical protein
MNNITISGAIGLSILKNGLKKVYIFNDDHSNINYCKRGVFLPSYLENIDNNLDTTILLEEPFIEDDTKLKYLWKETPHVELSRKHYDNTIKKCLTTGICYTFPIDIRLCLVDFSLDDIYANIENEEYFLDLNMTIDEYLRYIKYLFNNNDLELDEKNKEKNIFFIKNIFEKFKETYYYYYLKKRFDEFYSKFINHKKHMQIRDFIRLNNNKSYEFCEGYPFNNSNHHVFIDQYDKLINGIMEFYICILIFGISRNNTVIYTGYYHGNNLAYILKNIYRFELIKEYGVTRDIEKHLTLINISNCLQIDKKYFINKKN